MPAPPRPPAPDPRRRPTRPRRRTAPLGLAAALVAVVVVGSAAPVGAQVDATATDVADGRTTIELTVVSGCDGQDTTGVAVDVARRAADVEALPAEGGFTGEVADGRITWDGGTAPADEPATFTFTARLVDAAGQEVPLPTTQTCEGTEVPWTDLAGTGDNPAPVLVVPEGGGEAADLPAAAAVAAAPDDESALGGGAVGFMVFAGVMVALAGGATYLVWRSRQS